MHGSHASLVPRAYHPPIGRARSSDDLLEASSRSSAILDRPSPGLRPGLERGGSLDGRGRSSTGLATYPTSLHALSGGGPGPSFRTSSTTASGCGSAAASCLDSNLSSQLNSNHGSNASLLSYPTQPGTPSPPTPFATPTLDSVRASAEESDEGAADARAVPSAPPASVPGPASDAAGPSRSTSLDTPRRDARTASPPPSPPVAGGTAGVTAGGASGRPADSPPLTPPPQPPPRKHRSSRDATPSQPSPALPATPAPAESPMAPTPPARLWPEGACDDSRDSMPRKKLPPLEAHAEGAPVLEAQPSPHVHFGCNASADDATNPFTLGTTADGAPTLSAAEGKDSREEQSRWLERQVCVESRTPRLRSTQILTPLPP